MLEEEFLCYKDLQPGSVVTVSSSDKFVACVLYDCILQRAVFGEVRRPVLFSCAGQDCKLW